MCLWCAAQSIKFCTRELTYLIYILPVVVYREINIVHGLWIVVGTDTPLDDTINMFILLNPYLHIFYTA